MTQLLEDEKVVLESLDFDGVECVGCGAKATWAAECTQDECPQRMPVCDVHFALSYTRMMAAPGLKCIQCGFEGTPAEALRWVKL